MNQDSKVKWQILGLEQGIHKVSLEYLIVQKVRMCPNTNVDINKDQRNQFEQTKET